MASPEADSHSHSNFISNFHSHCRLSQVVTPALEKITKNALWRKHSKLAHECKSRERCGDEPVTERPKQHSNVDQHSFKMKHGSILVMRGGYTQEGLAALSAEAF